MLPIGEATAAGNGGRRKDSRYWLYRHGGDGPSGRDAKQGL